MSEASKTYFVVVGGEKHGPFSLPQLHEKLAQGKITATDYAWSDGMPEWVPIQAVVKDTTVRKQSPTPWSSPSVDLEMMVRRAQLVIKVALGMIIAAVLLLGYLMINS